MSVYADMWRGLSKSEVDRMISSSRKVLFRTSEGAPREAYHADDRCPAVRRRETFVEIEEVFLLIVGYRRCHRCDW